MAVKRAKGARKERHKLVLVGILGICLGAVLLWPDEAGEAPPQKESNSSRRRFATRPAAASQDPQSAQSATPADPPTATDAGLPIAGVELPRLDRERIAAADPFAPPTQPSAESSEPEAVRSEALAAAAARTSVRAVYRTSHGSAAIVDDQIIPVKDAKHWIETLRATD
ncbi:hypothetical protein [Candidatus Laterigemmans baculatus]|uniref:hypothetical protein n=1 Tax=Candidatus Laterigemmans baculatus TaxID=2770505 RepID=UPI0013DD63AC|nr:hypothetical protein [Candidatus Laterigemmans baculatus]